MDWGRGNVITPILFTTARAYASDKSLATFGTPMEGYAYARDYPDVTRGADTHPGEAPSKCVICAVSTGLIVIDVDDPGLFATTALGKLLAGKKTVQRGDRYHLYVDARSLGARGLWVKGAKVPGADIKGAGRGGFVMASGTVHPSGDTYAWLEDYVIVIWSAELEAALIADGCEIVPIAELGRSQVSADADEILNQWGIQPATEEDYLRVAGPDWGKPGSTNSAAVGVCHKLLSYADDHPESAGDVFARLVAGYESHPDYGGKGETAMRRALATAAASHVTDDEYAAEQDRAGWLKFFTAEEWARIEDRLARSPVPAAAAVPTGFWQQLPFLDHVQRAAYARMVSPFAVLLACLARLSGLIMPWDYRGELGLGPFPLSVFAAIMGTSSAGKTRAVGVAREILPLPAARFTEGAREAPPGSGEGIAHLFLAEKKDMSLVGPKGGRPPVILAQQTHNALLVADEGETLAALSGRSGSTFGAALRAAWSGQVLGSANVTKNKYMVERYALGVTAAFQPSILHDLLAAGDRGTPQRFLFADATDPGIPPAEFAPPWPGPFGLPQFHDASRFEDVPRFRLITFDESIVRKVRDYRHQVATGAVVPAELDGKEYEYTGRVAALLAAAHGWGAVTPGLWELAGAVWATSRAVRDNYARQAAAIEAKAEEDYRAKRAGRAVAEAEAVADAEAAYADHVAALIRDKAAAGADIREIARGMSRKQRNLFPTADDIRAVLEP